MHRCERDLIKKPKKWKYKVLVKQLGMCLKAVRSLHKQSKKGKSRLYLRHPVRRITEAKEIGSTPVKTKEKPLDNGRECRSLQALFGSQCI